MTNRQGMGGNKIIGILFDHRIKTGEYWINKEKTQNHKKLPALV